MSTKERIALEEMIRNGNRQCIGNHCCNCPFDTEDTCGLAALENVFMEIVKEDEERG